MANPAPRPALRKAPDAHINPALPTGTQIDLRHRDTPTAPKRTPEVTVEVSADEQPSADAPKGSNKKQRKKIKRKLERSAKARRKLRASKK